ncbi:MAG: DUF420 domain-containing protein [Clostridia bacterium]|nr:DUF420 domain-containing protein [Clostridia bacterium]
MGGGSVSLAALDTACIVLSGASLVVGRWFIARGNVRLHKAFMLTASAFALLFLVLYVLRGQLEGIARYPHTGPIRVVYFSVLISHTILATAVVPLAVVTLYRALRGRFADHRRVARWTFPVWLVVAITGWLIYLMLYVF